MRLFRRSGRTDPALPAWPQPVMTARVLLIDDDEDEMLLLRDAFAEIRHARYELDWVPSYGEGLARIAGGSHDAYLIDYRLGGMDGLDLVREARAAGSTAPLIMLTGERDPAVDVAATEAGASDFLEKGRTTPALLERAIRFGITHAHLVDSLQRSHAQIAGLEDLGRTLAREGPVPDALDQVVSLLTGPFDFAAAALYVLDRDRYELAAHAGYERPAAELAAGARLGHVLESGRPQLVPALVETGGRSASTGMELAAPLQADGRSHGVLVVPSGEDAAVAEQRAVALVADRVAVALALNRAIRA